MPNPEFTDEELPRGPRVIHPVEFFRPDAQPVAGIKDFRPAYQDARAQHPSGRALPGQHIPENPVQLELDYEAAQLAMDASGGTTVTVNEHPDGSLHVAAALPVIPPA